MAATKEHVLIVEADPDISDLVVRQTLEPLGYQVTLAQEGASAIQQAGKSPPDLVIANLNLPGLSGKDLLVGFAAQGIRAPFIVIAEKGQENDVIPLSVATSLAGVKPDGTVRTVPCRPCVATQSMCGSRAASSGVLPPSWGRGKSAAPSGRTMAYFIGGTLLAADRLRHCAR